MKSISGVSRDISYIYAITMSMRDAFRRFTLIRDGRYQDTEDIDELLRQYRAAFHAITLKIPAWQSYRASANA